MILESLDEERRDSLEVGAGAETETFARLQADQHAESHPEGWER
jgi:hypothetical protein